MSTGDASVKNTPSPTAMSGSRTWTATAKRIRDDFGALIGFAVVIAVFWLLKPQTFGTWENFKAILSQAAPTVVLAVGLTVVLTTAAFDLSFTGIIVLSSVCGVLLLRDSQVSTLVSVLASLGVGAALGLVSGGLVAMERASSFIVTLALGTVFSGFAFGISHGESVTAVPVSYLNITLKDFLGIPRSVIIALVVAVAAWAMLRWTVFGRQAQAIGSNPHAARLAGIRIALTRTGAFVVLGICAAITAVLLSSSTGGYNPNIGAGLFIPPYVAAFFGLAVLGARRFNVFGTVIGALFIGTLQTGLIIVGTEAWVGDVVVGAVLLTILMLATRRERA
jgi:ribose/xylose/arabinose/galactoside ABC-type transport system permease subunit